MAPKKTSTSTRARLPSTQEDPEEGNRSDGDDEEFAPSHNQLGNLDFYPIISPPSSRDTRTPARITCASALQFSTPREDIISEQQARQQEQLDKLFESVSKLGSDIRSANSAPTGIGNSVRGEANAPSPQGKGKASLEQHIRGDDDYGLENNDDDNGEDPL